MSAARMPILAEKSIADDFSAREITPVTRPDGTAVSADGGPRADVTLEAVSELKPTFLEGGTVTTGNCCPLDVGATALVVMSDAKAAELGARPLARIAATGVSCPSPEIMSLGPVEASKRALANAGMSINDIDLVEINEAFAAQVIPSYQDLGIDIDMLNVDGGAIALGHPFSMTGAPLQNTMLDSPEWHDKNTSLITICVGEGQGWSSSSSACELCAGLAAALTPPSGSLLDRPRLVASDVPRSRHPRDSRAEAATRHCSTRTVSALRDARQQPSRPLASHNFHALDEGKLA